MVDVLLFDLLLSLAANWELNEEGTWNCQMRIVASSKVSQEAATPKLPRLALSRLGASPGFYNVREPWLAPKRLNSFELSATGTNNPKMPRVVLDLLRFTKRTGLVHNLQTRIKNNRAGLENQIPSRLEPRL